jgi:hypothetical protein
MTGGISSGVMYFGIDTGSSVPPGIAAQARGKNFPYADIYKATVLAPANFRKLRLVIMTFSLIRKRILVGNSPAGM